MTIRERRIPPVRTVLKRVAAAGLLLSCGGCLPGCVTARQGKAAGGSGGIEPPSPAGMARTGEELMIAGAGHLPGAGGTVWRTDLAVLNVGSDPARIRVELLRRGEPNPSPQSRQWEIAPGATLRLEDVLSSAFGADGAAALRIVAERGRIAAASRTYNLAGGGGATYGQVVPALGRGDIVCAGDAGWITGLDHDPSGEGFRSNLLLVNGTGGVIVAEVELVDGDGAGLGTVAVELRPWEPVQLNAVFERVTSAAVAGGSAVVRVLTGGARVWTIASVVDNGTGDPVALAPALESVEVEPSGATPPALVVSGAARVAGAAGTDWFTELRLTHRGASLAIVLLRLLPRGAGDPVDVQVQLLPGETISWGNVLEELFGTDGAGTILVTRFGGPVTVAARTYNRLGPGNPQGLPVGATFGQSLPMVRFTEMLTQGRSAWIPMLDHDPGLGAGRRTNLLLTNLAPVPIDVELVLRDADGAVLGALTETLEGQLSTQINRVFDRVTAGSVAGGSIEIRHDTPGGRLVALASVVDNLTGDPSAIPAIAARAPRRTGGVEAALELVELVGADGGAVLGEVLGAAADGTTVNLMDDLASAAPASVSRTDDGVVIDYGGATVLDDGRVATGTVEVSSSGGGKRASGAFSADLSELVVGGASFGAAELEGTFSGERAGDGVRVDLLLTPPPGGGAERITGELAFDTGFCGDAPSGGLLEVTEDDEMYQIDLGGGCNERLQINPTVDFLVFRFAARGCDGSWMAGDREVRLIEIGGRLMVDPTAQPADQVGRQRWQVAGTADEILGAWLVFSRVGPGGAPDLTGWFRGGATRRGDLVYWTGIMGYTVEPGGCDRTWIHLEGDTDHFAALQNCPDGCNR